MAERDRQRSPTTNCSVSRLAQNDESEGKSDFSKTNDPLLVPGSTLGIEANHTGLTYPHGCPSPRQVNGQDARTSLSAVLLRVVADEESIVARTVRACAGLAPMEPRPQRRLGFLQGTVEESFFAPLPESWIQAWEGCGKRLADRHQVAQWVLDGLGAQELTIHVPAAQSLLLDLELASTDAILSSFEGVGLRSG